MVNKSHASVSLAFTGHAWGIPAQVGVLD